MCKIWKPDAALCRSRWRADNDVDKIIQSYMVVYWLLARAGTSYGKRVENILLEARDQRNVACSI